MLHRLDAVAFWGQKLHWTVGSCFHSNTANELWAQGPCGQGRFCCVLVKLSWQCSVRIKIGPGIGGL